MKKVLIIGAIIACVVYTVVFLLDLSPQIIVREVTIHTTNEVIVKVASGSASNEAALEQISVSDGTINEEDDTHRVRLSSKFVRSLAPVTQQTNQ